MSVPLMIGVIMKLSLNEIKVVGLDSLVTVFAESNFLPFSKCLFLSELQIFIISTTIDLKIKDDKLVYSEETSRG